MNLFFNRAEASPSIQNYQDYQSETHLKGIVHYNKFVSFFLRHFSSKSLDLADKTVNTGSVTRYICERYLNLQNPKTNKEIWDKVKATVEETGKTAQQKTLDNFIQSVVEQLATKQEITQEKEPERRNLAQIVQDALKIEEEADLAKATKIKEFLEKANTQQQILHPQDTLIQKVQNRVLVLKLQQMKTSFSKIFPSALNDYTPKTEDADKLNILQKYLELTLRFHNITNDPSSQAAATAQSELSQMKTAIITALSKYGKYEGIQPDQVKNTLDNLERVLQNAPLQILPVSPPQQSVATTSGQPPEPSAAVPPRVSEKEKTPTIQSLTQTLTGSLESFRSKRNLPMLNTALKTIEDQLDKIPQSEEKEAFTKNLQIIHSFCTKALNRQKAHEAIDDSEALKTALQKIIPTSEDAASMLLLQARLNSTLHTLTTLQADQIKQGFFTLAKGYLEASVARGSPDDQDAQKLTTMLKDFTGVVVNLEPNAMIIANLDMLRDFFNPPQEGYIQSATRYVVSFLYTPPQPPTEATYKALEDAISVFKNKISKK